MRPAAGAERDRVQELVLASYAEFEPSLEPAHWVGLQAALRRIVAPGAPGVLLVATSGSTLAGTVTYLPAGPREYRHVPQSWAVVRGMAVPTALRGRGVGRLLLRECLRRAEADGVPAVGLHTAAIMTAARRMYQSEGFVQLSDFPRLGLTFCVYGRTSRR